MSFIASLRSVPQVKFIWILALPSFALEYIVSSPEATRRTADLINRYPDRFLFGTDTVAPKDAKAYYAVYDMYQPLWKLLTPEAREGVLKKNYERIFNEGRKNARAWEKAHPAVMAG